MDEQRERERDATSSSAIVAFYQMLRENIYSEDGATVVFIQWLYQVKRASQPWPIFLEYGDVKHLDMRICLSLGFILDMWH